MSFEVDPDALDKFSDLLDSYGWDADQVAMFLKDKTEISVHSEGLLNKLVIGHSTIVGDMNDRMTEMHLIGTGSGSNMKITASKYRETDESGADKMAKIDAGYGDPKPYKDDDRKGEPDKATFDYKDIDGQLELDKKPSDLEPKASEIETWAREKLDELSIMAGVRTALEWICGVDVIDWLWQWWIGDWKAWAKCALAWDACGDAVDVMAENLWRAIPALDSAWDGQAANQANTYFEKLRDATYTEVDAFKALYGLYKWIMEAIYALHQIINDAVNTAVEIVISILMAPVKGGQLIKQLASNPDMVWKVWETFGTMQTIITAAMDIVSIVEWIGKADDLKDVPASELKKLADKKHPDDPEYHHPGEDDWFTD